VATESHPARGKKGSSDSEKKKSLSGRTGGTRGGKRACPAEKKKRKQEKHLRNLVQKKKKFAHPSREHTGRNIDHLMGQTEEEIGR